MEETKKSKKTTVKKVTKVKPEVSESLSYAVVEINNQQEKVQEGQRIEVQSIKGDTFKFDKVLAFFSEKESKFGNPYISGAYVEAKKVLDFKDKKIRVETFKAKSRYRKVRGHRQPKSILVVEKINV